MTFAPERLGFAAKLIRPTNIRISQAYDGNVKPEKLWDDYGPLNVYMLPFIKPLHVRMAYPESDITTYTEAVKGAISHMEIDPEQRNVLIAHGELISDKTDVKGNNKLSMNCILEMSDNIKNQIFFDGFEFMLSDGSIIRIDFATIKSNIHENVIEFECSAPLYDVFPEMKTHINQLSTAQITNVYYDTEDDIKPVRLIEVKIYDPNRNYYYTKNKEVPNVQ